MESPTCNCLYTSESIVTIIPGTSSWSAGYGACPTSCLLPFTSPCWLHRVLDSLHLALCIHMLYWYLVTNYGNSLELLEVQWSFQVSLVLLIVLFLLTFTRLTRLRPS